MTRVDVTFKNSSISIYPLCWHHWWRASLNLLIALCRKHLVYLNLLSSLLTDQFMYILQHPVDLWHCLFLQWWVKNEQPLTNSWMDACHSNVCEREWWQLNVELGAIRGRDWSGICVFAWCRSGQRGEFLWMGGADHVSTRAWVRIRVHKVSVQFEVITMETASRWLPKL